MEGCSAGPKLDGIITGPPVGYLHRAPSLDDRVRTGTPHIYLVLTLHADVRARPNASVSRVKCSRQLLSLPVPPLPLSLRFDA
jgi:hypothetical protein